MTAASSLTTLPLEQAQRIVDVALARRTELGLKPLTVAVLDATQSVKLLVREDGTSTLRPDMAIGKARGAIALGLGSRAIFERAQQQPFFVQAVNALSDGALVPVPGGVLAVKDGVIVGAVGITGDTSDNDEICAVAGIQAAGYDAQTGA